MQTVFTVSYISERFLLDLKNTNGVLNAINLNPLGYFLGSNLLCGLINITVKTLYLSQAASTALYTMYLIIPAVGFGFLRKYNIKLFI